MIKAAGFRVLGRSVSGLGTAVCLPGLPVVFDMGVCIPEAVHCRTVFITHTHVDHVGAVAVHAATRQLRGLPPSQFVVSPEMAPALKKVLDLFGEMQADRLAYEIVPLAPGEEWAAPFPGTWVVRPFVTDHLIPSQGYELWRIFQKLRPEFVGLSKTQIRHLRVEEGVQVAETVERLEVACTGDTRPTVFDHPGVRQARLLITEATFVDKGLSDEFAWERGHTHMRQVAERADALENEAVVLTHFSARHSVSSVIKALECLPEDLHKRTQVLTTGLKD